MELRSKLLEQIAFNTRPKIEEHMLIVMDKRTHEGHLSQPLQVKRKLKSRWLFDLVKMVFLMSEIQKLSFISIKQLLTMMVLFKLV